MKVLITVMNNNDFEFGERKNTDTGEIKQTCSFKALVTDPMNLLTIVLNEDQIRENVVGRLLEKQGQQQEVFIDYKPMSFADSKGQHVAIHRHVFIGFPDNHKK